MLFILEREVPAFLRLLILPTSEFLAIMTAQIRNISECEDFTVVLAAFKYLKYFRIVLFWNNECGALHWYGTFRKSIDF